MSSSHRSCVIMTEPIVELQSGFVRGIREKHEEGVDYYSFKGIPYAESPIGVLRFKHDGPMCLQYDFLFKIKSCEEDCLYLNVFTRWINENNKKCPVLVIVHFGMSLFGSANSSFYGPDYLIRKDVVLMMPNYRLGVLGTAIGKKSVFYLMGITLLSPNERLVEGFLNLEDEVAPGNQGFKDLVIVLEWVQINIQLFGGDPNNVTVFGNVGGAAGANYLASSPLTEEVYQSLQASFTKSSSVVYNTWTAVNNPKSHAIKLCSLLGKNLTDSREILGFLTSLEAEKLVDAQERLRRSLDCFPFGPGVDEKSRNPFMPVHRYAAADQGIHLSHLVGCSSHESLITLSSNQNFGIILAHSSKEILSRYNLTEAQVRRLYYKNRTISRENLDIFLEFAQDIYFSEGIHRFARVQAERNSAATYLYQLSYVPPDPLCAIILENMVELSKRGCGHFEEVPLLFKMRAVEGNGLPCSKKGTQSYKLQDHATNDGNVNDFHQDMGDQRLIHQTLFRFHWLPVNDGTVISQY